MRNVVIYSLVSLDGVAESPDRYVFDFDEVMYENLGRVIGSQDAVLLGRRMYDDWSQYWPTADDQPFADFINGTPKYVATSSTPTTGWAGTTVVEGSFEDAVRELKAGEGGDIGVHGSISLCQSLLHDGLVDEVRLVIAPVTVGAGRRLFVDDEVLRRFELIRCVGTPTGSVLADYRVRSEA